MKQDKEGARAEAEEEIALERNISEGLRDRIGRLEEKVRAGRRDLQESLSREKSLREDCEEEKRRREEQERKYQSNWTDMRDAVSSEKGKSAKLEDELTALREEKQVLMEELRMVKVQASVQRSV